MPELNNPHDAFFKQFLSKIEIASDFLRQHLPATIIDELNLSTLALQKDSFIDEELRPHYSDLLYRANLNTGGPAHVYLLFEHKSYVDEQVAFQVLRYLMQLWEKELRETGALSPVITLVVYHGRAKWSVPTNFGALLTAPGVFRPYLPDFQYHLADLSALSDEEIRGEIWSRVFQLPLKHIFDDNLGERLPNILLLAHDLAQQASGLAMLATILRYVSRAGRGATREEIRQAVTAILPSEGGVLVATAAEQWIEEGKVLGLKQGLEQGHEQGLEQGLEQGRVIQRRTVLKILRRRFTLTDDDVVTFADQLAHIRNIELLEKVVDDALTATVLVDFATRLETYFQAVIHQNVGRRNLN